MKHITDLDKDWEVPATKNGDGEILEFYTHKEDLPDGQAREFVKPFVFKAELRLIRVSRETSGNTPFFEFDTCEGIVLTAHPSGIESIFKQLHAGYITLTEDNRLRGEYVFKKGRRVGVFAVTRAERRKYGL